MNLMLAIQSELPDLRIKFQKSPVGSSASNGAAERSARTITQFTLTSALDCEARTGCQEGNKDRSLKWATRHASWLYNRLSVKTGSNATPSRS